MTSIRRILHRRSLIRLLIIIPLTWILFSLMYSFHGRSSSFSSGAGADIQTFEEFPVVHKSKLAKNDVDDEPNINRIEQQQQDDNLLENTRSPVGVHKHHYKVCYFEMLFYVVFFKCL